MRSKLKIVATAGAIALVTLAGATSLSLQPLPEQLAPPGETGRARVVDAQGRRLSESYGDGWNLQDQVSLEHVPPFLREVLVLAEDQRYWTRDGADWNARIAALKQNVIARRAVRGASTISEQVVRMLHPRPRNLWSRWLESFEAMQLERRFDKSRILEFYLNQVPYGARRRGVVQAARYAYGRELETLSRKEMLALAVLPRAPTRLDIRRDPQGVDGPIGRLLPRVVATGLLTEQQAEQLRNEPLMVAPARDDPPLAHYLSALRQEAHAAYTQPPLQLQGSIDRELQREAYELLANRVSDLGRMHVTQGALLVIDLQGNKVRAWAVADSASRDAMGIDAVLAPRQPGSTLKPFLYALALESGWSAATRIRDDDLSAHVGTGLHAYHNYSHVNYGEVSVREALGNSLNIPALKTLQYVGGERFLSRLHQLGFNTLDLPAPVYGDGLALGNGEVRLLHLAQAYSTLAHQGEFLPVTLLERSPQPAASKQVMSPEAASIVTDILSDPRARLLEFGEGGLLRFPEQTAVKTGTSSDYRDAWTVAYNHRYVVAAWMGNLSRREMDGVTGSIGPALLVRSMFARLNREVEPAPLPRSAKLIARSICADGPERADCPRTQEWFMPGALPEQARAHAPGPAQAPQLLQPFDGLRLAMDPRIPDASEAFEFRVQSAPAPRYDWYVDDQLAGTSARPAWRWHLARGEHRAWVEMVTMDGTRARTTPVSFVVR